MSSGFFYFVHKISLKFSSGFDRRRYCAAGAGTLPYLVAGRRKKSRHRAAFAWACGGERGILTISRKRLANQRQLCYNLIEKQRCGGLGGCWNTRKPMQVRQHLHNDRKVAPHGILYDILPLCARGGLSFFPHVVLHQEDRSLLTLCRHMPAQRFCFSPRPPEGHRPSRREG